MAHVAACLILACLPLAAQAASKAGEPPRPLATDSSHDGEGIESLEEAAASLAGQGRIGEADRIYSRLLERTLDNPAQALRYAFAKWHLRQGYAAQAALIRALRNGELSVGNGELARTTLDGAYDEANVVKALRREFSDPDAMEGLAALESRWLEICREVRRLEEENDPAGIRLLASTFLGGGRPAIYHAVWRGYALVYRGDLEAAVAELNYALDANSDGRTEIGILAALRLIREFSRSALSNELLDRVSEVVSGVSTAVGEQFSDNYAAAGQMFEEAERLVRERDFAAASVELERLSRLFLDAEQRARFLFLLAEVQWEGEAYSGANQGYIAAQALSRDRYTRSAALIKMAEYASMTGDPEAAALFAERSADALPDQSWKLRQVGNFFVGLGRPERGIGYLERSLVVSATVQDDAEAYAGLAEAYKRLGDRDEYLGAASDYIAAVSEIGDGATPGQEGMRFYYQGEILASRGDRAGAYAAYERASALVEDRFRLAEILMNMAGYEADQGNAPEAVTLAKRSAELIPDQDWKLRQVGELLVRLDEREEGFQYLDDSLERATTPAGKLASYAVLAETRRSTGDNAAMLANAREYVALEAANRDVLSNAEAGLAAFYQGEILMSEGKSDQAFLEYERASGLVTEDFRLSEIFYKMAEIEERRGRREQAADYAERSATALPDAWKLRQVGDFFIRLDMPDKGFEYFSRFAQAGATPEDQASVYATMADAYKDLGDVKNYLRFAGEYVEAVSAEGRTPTRAEEGLVAFYQGETHRLRNEAGPAFDAYERASRLLADAFRRSEALMRMAEILSVRGERAAAAEMAERSAREVPDEWKQRQVADFLLRLGLAERAAGHFERVAGPGGETAVYAAMADAFREQGDTENYLRAAGNYVDAVAAEGRASTVREQSLAAFYEGEILAARNDIPAALAAYGRSAGLSPDAFFRSGVYTRMAEIHASAKDKEQAAVYAEKAAAELPNEDWKLRQIGDLYERLEMPGKAIEYYEDVVRVSESPKTRALAHAALAEVYKKMNEPEKYLRHAGEYVAAVAAGAFFPSREDEGLRFFYEGEIHQAKGEAEQAYRSFLKASELITESYRLSDVFIRMARYQVGNGDKDKAVEYAERSLDLLPDQGWRVMEVGDVYARLELTDKAIEYYQLVVELTPETGNRTAAYTSLAEVYKKLGNQERYVHYARLYVEALAERQGDVSGNERALALFYRGEAEAFDGEADKAYQSFAEAARLFTDTFRLSDIAMKQAEYHAKRNELDQAAVFADKSAALLPDEAWRQRGVGDFFSSRDLMDKAIRYYNRTLELSRTPETRAAAYVALADAYNKIGDKAMYIAMARQAIAALSQKSGEPTMAEKAQQGYYLGEILTADGDPAGAYAAYEYASRFIEDKYRLSDVLVAMARYNADHGDKDLAARQAIEAAALLPDQDWRVQGAMDILADLRRFDDALRVVETAVAMNPTANMRLYRSLAQRHANARNRKSALFYNARFIDLLTDKIEFEGPSATKGELQELWDTRDWQNGQGRVWGLDSYYFGKRWPSSGDYFVGMSHELFRYYNLSNGMNGKFYANFGGTLTAKYSGHYLENSQMQNWMSRPRLPDTSQLILGVNLNPFRSGAFISSVSVSAEYVFGTGRDQEDDFRFRTGFDKTYGDKPRPFGKYWKYWKAYSNTVYSTRKNDVTSAGDYRLGVAIATGRSGNLLFMPHALATHSYGGKTVDKGERWGFDVGVGLSVRKWFREDRHNTPRSYVDVQVYYHHALTHRRKSGPGFVVTTSF